MPRLVTSARASLSGSSGTVHIDEPKSTTIARVLPLAAVVAVPALFSWAVLALFQLPIVTGIFFACKEDKGLLDPSEPVKDYRCFQQQAFGLLLDMGRVYPGLSALVVILSSLAITLIASLAAIAGRSTWRWANYRPSTLGIINDKAAKIEDSMKLPCFENAIVLEMLCLIPALSVVLVPILFLAFVNVSWVARPVNMTRSAGNNQAKPNFYNATTQARLLPDVLLVVIDDMNMDWLEPWAANFTPHFHALASRPGTTNFQEAYAHVPKCAPSRLSLLTGLSVGDSGLRKDGSTSSWRYTLPDTPSLPEHLKQWYGFETYGAGKVFHDGQPIVFHHNEWTDYWPSMNQQVPDAVNASCYAGGIPWGDVLNTKLGGGLWNCSGEQHPDGLVAEYTAAKLRATENSTAPLFIAAGLKHPHLPWFPDLEALKTARGGKLPFERTSDTQPILADLPHDICNVGHFIADSVAEMDGSTGLELMVEYYSASTSFTDRHLGTILAAADQVPRPRITVVISDHGFGLGERGHVKKYVPWRMSSRAPFLVHDARLEAASGVDLSARAWVKPVSFLDVFPTLLDGLCSDTFGSEDGSASLANCQDQSLYLSGRSLWPIVARESDSEAIETFATVEHGTFYFVRAVYYPDGISSFVKYGPDADHTECYANSTTQEVPLNGACEEGSTLAAFDHAAALRAVTKFDVWFNKPLLCVAMLAHLLLGVGWLFYTCMVLIYRRVSDRVHEQQKKGEPLATAASSPDPPPREAAALPSAAVSSSPMQPI